ncbi:MAG: hypothetical protein IJI85_10320 [Clostridia bacterium]|nr:hypothetical protein [Clostridia bacterium]
MAANYETKLLEGLLSSVTLSDTGVEKRTFYDPAIPISGRGVLIVLLTDREQPYPGQPIWFVSVSVRGVTFPSVDTEQSIIRQMYTDALKSVQGWMAAGLTTAVGLKIDGILPVTTAAIRGSADRYTFAIDFRLAMSDVSF